MQVQDYRELGNIASNDFEVHITSKQGISKSYYAYPGIYPSSVLSCSGVLSNPTFPNESRLLCLGKSSKFLFTESRFKNKLNQEKQEKHLLRVAQSVAALL